MKKCIHQKKAYGGKITCNCTGTVRWACDIRSCKLFRPTLRFKLFGKWFR